MKPGISAFILAAVLMMPAAAFAQDPSPLINTKRMTLETALRVAHEALLACRAKGVQVAVTVVDRGGHVQAQLRDVLAMDLALEISRQKAYTAMSFNLPGSELARRFDSPNHVGKVDGVLFAAGGLPISAQGSILGGVGVSGAPSGKTDEACAQAGVQAVHDELEMAD